MYININNFTDEFGNLEKEFEVIQYEKMNDGEWLEICRIASGRTYFEIDGKLYHKLGNSSFSLNMDFESPSCNACYAAGNEIVNSRKITGNYILGSYTLLKNVVKLYKQTYADGTSHYNIKESNGMSRVEHSSKNPKSIINQLKHEINVYKKYMDEFNKDAHLHIMNVYEEIISCLENELLVTQ